MGIKINKLKSIKDTALIKPVEMLKMPDHIFRQYFKGKPQKVYYINCGFGEENLVTIWWDDESRKYRLSTDSKKDLKQYVESVLVADVTENISISIDITD